MNEAFRRRLSLEMDRQGLNPASLSQRAGLNRRAVTDLLEGRAQSPKLSTAYSLAAALDLSIDELIGVVPRVHLEPHLAELLSHYSADDQARLAQAIQALPAAPASKP